MNNIFTANPEWRHDLLSNIVNILIHKEMITILLHYLYYSYYSKNCLKTVYTKEHSDPSKISSLAGGGGPVAIFWEIGRYIDI